MSTVSLWTVLAEIPERVEVIKDRKEPCTKWRSRFLKYSTKARIDLCMAKLTWICLAVFDLVVLGDTLTPPTDSIGITEHKDFISNMRHHSCTSCWSPWYWTLCAIYQYYSIYLHYRQRDKCQTNPFKTHSKYGILCSFVILVFRYKMR